MPASPGAVRRLVRDPGADTGGEKLGFRFELSEDVDEDEVERQLLSLVYRFHPAFDEATGSLKEGPGIRELKLKGPEFYLLAPDADGIARFGGVRIPAQDKDAFLAELRALGWSVVES